VGLESTAEPTGLGDLQLGRVPAERSTQGSEAWRVEVTHCLGPSNKDKAGDTGDGLIGRNLMEHANDDISLQHIASFKRLTASHTGHTGHAGHAR
jgi:hypothetical protein